MTISLQEVPFSALREGDAVALQPPGKPESGPVVIRALEAAGYLAGVDASGRWWYFDVTTPFRFIHRPRRSWRPGDRLVRTDGSQPGTLSVGSPHAVGNADQGPHRAVKWPLSEAIPLAPCSACQYAREHCGGHPVSADCDDMPQEPGVSLRSPSREGAAPTATAPLPPVSCEHKYVSETSTVCGKCGDDVRLPPVSERLPGAEIGLDEARQGVCPVCGALTLWSALAGIAVCTSDPEHTPVPVVRPATPAKPDGGWGPTWVWFDLCGRDE